MLAQVVMGARTGWCLTSRWVNGVFLFDSITPGLMHVL